MPPWLREILLPRLKKPRVLMRQKSLRPAPSEEGHIRFRCALNESRSAFPQVYRALRKIVKGIGGGGREIVHHTALQ